MTWIKRFEFFVSFACMIKTFDNEHEPLIFRSGFAGGSRLCYGRPSLREIAAPDTAGAPGTGRSRSVPGPLGLRLARGR